MRVRSACIITVAVLVFSIVGCSMQSSTSQSPYPSDSMEIGETVHEEEPVEESSSSKSLEEATTTADTEFSTDRGQQIDGQNIAVVYFSATGNTKNIAEMIGNFTGAEVFELTPEDPYSDEDLNFNEESSRVVQEYENEDQREIKLSSTEIPNWSEYDTIFLGYPIWWGIAAWPINDFVLNNDFDSKTVYPFCSSLSSGVGQSAQLLADEASSGHWEEGHRFSESADESAVEEWIRSLGIE
ncbi:MAG: flavodoxin [Clostridia bacterium]|nr:flavodoxin [Clostridia bacterium]